MSHLLDFNIDRHGPPDAGDNLPCMSLGVLPRREPNKIGQWSGNRYSQGTEFIQTVET